MSEDFIQVQPDSTGKKLRTTKRTVGINDVHEEFVTPIATRVRDVTGAYVLSMHRNLGDGTLMVPFHFWAFVNPTGSGKVVYIRRLKFESTVSTSYGVVASVTNIAQYILFRASAVSGGVDRSSEIEKKDTAGTASIANVLTRETSSQTAISATLAQAVRRGLAQAWGWGHQGEMFAALPDPELNDGFVLREDQGLVLQSVNTQLNLGYFCTLEWEEA